MIQVNEKTCTRCGFCASVCSDGIIDFQNGDYPKPVPMNEKRCLHCGHCVAVCPTGSLTHRDLPLDQFPLIQKNLKIDEAQCEQFLRARRSIREFKKQPVPRDLVTRLINIAHYAPTGHNNQDVNWMVIDNPQEILKIEHIAADWMKLIIQSQPRMAEMLNFKELLVRQEKDYNAFLRGAPAVVIAISAKDSPIALVDCTIALTYLELAATSLGLGGCWAGMAYFMANSYPAMQEALSIPDGQAAHGFMMLGYPKYAYSRLAMRKPANIIWHK